MSSISLNTGAQNLLYPLLNNQSNENPLLAALAGGATSPLGANTTLADGAPSSGAGRHGPNSELFQKVQQAVTRALTSIQGNPSADPNQVIQQAILQVIGQTTNGSSGSTGATTAADPDGDGDPSGGAGSATQSFFSSLKDYGIDPQQFQSDFLTALTQAQQTGQANSSTAFSSFPTGLSVDTAA